METEKLKNPKWMTITGWVITTLIFLMMGAGSIVMQLTNPQMVSEGMAQQGFSPAAAKWITIVEIACAILYFIPQTAVLGAILLTGFFGGAVSVHVRSNDGLFFVPVIFGVITWLGIYLREPRLRAIALWRK